MHKRILPLLLTPTCGSLDFTSRHRCLQVLFCGEELYYSFVYTSEALQGDPLIKVSVVDLFLALLQDSHWDSVQETLAARFPDAPNLRCEITSQKQMWRSP